MKVEPFSGALISSIVPSIAATSMVVIDKPKPVPPYFLAIEESAWVNFSKIIFWFYGSMPMPVSVTEIETALTSSLSIGLQIISTWIPPFSVNLIALLHKFTII